ncbi:MAG: hypothetical protein AUJ57_01890 [Zetaproteobacteria bacterium CG1_02_53_45]|nr:MAG: hypothetical protein AUJ57_01890 [Zetaproteobacteria bacterium CG1_02_53_45]
MKRSACALIFWTVLLSGCATVDNNIEASQMGQLLQPHNPLQCQEIPGNEAHERLCLLMTENKGDFWFVAGEDEYSKNRIVEALSFMEEGNGGVSFGEFSISPGGSYLAVIIAEEGHPILLFRQLQNTLQDQDEPENLPGIATYPGSMAIKGWQGDDLIVISSDQDLVHYQHGGEVGESHDYLLHLPDGKVSPAIAVAQ